MYRKYITVVPSCMSVKRNVCLEQTVRTQLQTVSSKVRASHCNIKLITYIKYQLFCEALAAVNSPSWLISMSHCLQKSSLYYCPLLFPGVLSKVDQRARGKSHLVLCCRMWLVIDQTVLGNKALELTGCQINSSIPLCLSLPISLILLLYIYLKTHIWVKKYCIFVKHTVTANQ